MPRKKVIRKSKTDKKPLYKKGGKMAYANGGGLVQGDPNQAQAGQYDQQITGALDTAVPGAGAITSLMASAGRGVSEMDTNVGTQIAADTINPLSQIDALTAGNFKEAVPIIGSFEKSKRLKEEAVETDRLKREAVKQGITQQSRINLNSYNVQGKGNFAKGGVLNSISTSAVEVKANGKGTDTVDIGSAMVDNKEIIDNKNRVFSHDLKTATGKPIATEAKRLEKMKTDGFARSNRRINRKLDKLFDYQQSINGESTGEEAMAGGGYLSKDNLAKGGGLKRSEDYGSKKKPYPSVPSSEFAGGKRSYPIPTKADAVDALRLAGLHNRPDVKAKVYDKYPSLKQNKANGGTIDTSFLDPRLLAANKRGMFDPGQKGVSDQSVIPQSTAPNDAVRLANADTSVTGTAPTQAGANGAPNLNMIANVAGTFGSNIANDALIRKTPKVPIPVQEQTVSLPRISTRDIEEDVNRSGRLQRLATNRNTAQSGGASAVNALGKAQEIQALNKLKGETRRTNADIAARETGVNVGIQGRNVGRSNLANQQDVERTIAMNALKSQNYADVGNKFMLGRAERNQMTLDKSRLALLKKQYQDSGVYDRNMEETIKSLEANVQRRVSGI